MATADTPPVSRQLARARRRLVAQALVNHLAVAWTAALALGAVWLLAEPFAAGKQPANVRAAVVGSLFAAATAAALVRAARRVPSPNDAALALDERFGLHERVTTAVSLSDADRATPAGVALVADANAKVAALDVGGRFPVRLGWNAAGVPAAAAVLALVALFYDPVLPTRTAAAADQRVAPEDAKEVEQKLKELGERAKREKKPEDKGKSEKFQQIEADLEKLLKQPRDTRDELRERVKELSSLEDELRKLEKQETEKAQQLKDQLARLDKITKHEKGEKREGALAKFEEALSKGDMEEAKKEVDQLRKKAKEKGLDEKEREELKKQVEELQDKLERIARGEDKKEELKKLHRDGKLDAETLQRELQKLEKQLQQMDKDQLEQLAQKMQQCKKCLEQKDVEKLEQSLEELGEQLDQMGNPEDDISELEDSLQRLQQLRKAMAKACEGECEGNCKGEKEGKGGKGVGSGERPENKGPDLDGQDERQAGRFNHGGRKTYAGSAPGQAFKKSSTQELSGDIKQAAQEAPEAIEVQRIPKAARDMAKGYFRNLGGQADAPKKP